MMEKPEKEPVASPTVVIEKRSQQEAEQADTESVQHPGEVLMPELEELVRKNPNRLIGCGG